MGVFSATSPLIPVHRHCVSPFRPRVLCRQGLGSPSDRRLLNMNMRFLETKGCKDWKERHCFPEPARRPGQRMFSDSVCPPQGEGRIPPPARLHGCPVFSPQLHHRKGQKFCGNPKLPWVQKYMKNLDAKQRKPPTGTRADEHYSPVWRHQSQQHLHLSPALAPSPELGPGSRLPGRLLGAW